MILKLIYLCEGIGAACDLAVTCQFICRVWRKHPLLRNNSFDVGCPRPLVWNLCFQRVNFPHFQCDAAIASTAERHWPDADRCVSWAFLWDTMKPAWRIGQLWRSVLFALLEISDSPKRDLRSFRLTCPLFDAVGYSCFPRIAAGHPGVVPWLPLPSCPKYWEFGAVADGTPRITRVPALLTGNIVAPFVRQIHVRTRYRCVHDARVGWWYLTHPMDVIACIMRDHNKIVPFVKLEKLARAKFPDRQWNYPDQIPEPEFTWANHAHDDEHVPELPNRYRVLPKNLLEAFEAAFFDPEPERFWKLE